MDYDHDEALRVVGVTAMFEGNTYEFRVHNSKGAYTVYLLGHTLPGEDGLECRHAGDPCAHAHRNLKDAIDRSIQEHSRRFHHLKVIT
jgi:hypothetical protein